MNFIKRIIGKITLPDEVFIEKHNIDRKWVRCEGMPMYNHFYYADDDCEEHLLRCTFSVSREYPYCYRSIEQDWTGAWKEGNTHLGLWNPLEKLV